MKFLGKFKMLYLQLLQAEILSYVVQESISGLWLSQIGCLQLAHISPKAAADQIRNLQSGSRRDLQGIKCWYMGRIPSMNLNIHEHGMDLAACQFIKMIVHACQWWKQSHWYTSWMTVILHEVDIPWRPFPCWQFISTRNGLPFVLIS